MQIYVNLISTIFVQSEPGEGTTFSIYLPRLIDSKGQVTSETAVTAPKGHGTILLVEDEEAVRRITKLMLENLGYKIIASDSSEHALSIVGEHTIQINCVLSDLIMPGINGIELKKQIQTIKPDIPFVFMSGYTADIIGKEFSSSGEFEIIQKPVNFKVLDERLASAIQKSIDRP